MIVRAVESAFERRALPTTDIGWRQLYQSGGLGFQTAAGRDVSETTALTLSAVYACVRIISESVAQLPLILYQRVGRAKRRAMDHPLWALLHGSPNTRQTAYEFKRFAASSLALRGNTVAAVIRDLTGRVVQIWPLRWEQVEVLVDPLDQSKLLFRWRPSTGSVQEWRQSEVWYAHGQSIDGVVGVSPIGYAREAMGLGLTLQDYAARYFGNGARPGGVLETEQQLSDEAAVRLRESWQAQYSGDNAHRVAVLEQGLKYHAISASPEDAQFLESRKFSVLEVSRWFGVPPHMIFDLERATFSNIEHQSLEFVKFHLGPWLVNIETTLERDLLSAEERSQGYYLKFNVGGLLRGDSVARSNSHRTGVLTGYLTRNEVRELEDLDPIEGLDEPLTPLNMAQGSEPQIEIPSDEETQRARMRAALRPILLDAASRIVHVESREIRKTRGARAEIEALYAPDGEIRTYAARALAPVLHALQVQMDPIVEQVCADALAELAVCELEPTLARWRDLRAAEIAGAVTGERVAAAPPPKPRSIRRTVVRDAAGRIAEIVDTEA
jgi:HK97 family phage portal protein